MKISSFVTQPSSDYGAHVSEMQRQRRVEQERQAKLSARDWDVVRNAILESRREALGDTTIIDVLM